MDNRVGRNIVMESHPSTVFLSIQNAPPLNIGDDEHAKKEGKKTT